MIYVKRTDEPKYLKDRAAKWLKDLRAARKSKDKIAYKIALDRYSNGKIRDALDVMCSGKCVYCEVVIAVVATGHIEHFRPKQKYPSLAFTWKNLVLGCPTCNDGAHKGTKFPKASQKGPLIDPSEIDPSKHIRFVYDPVTHLALAKAITPQGQLSIDTFGLNTRADLVRDRSMRIRTLLALKLQEMSNSEYAEILALSRYGRTPFHAWIRALQI